MPSTTVLKTSKWSFTKNLNKTYKKTNDSMAPEYYLGSQIAILPCGFAAQATFFKFANSEQVRATGFHEKDIR